MQTPISSLAGDKNDSNLEKINHFSEYVPKLPYVEWFLKQKPETNSYELFAEESHWNPAIREQEWDTFETMLKEVDDLFLDEIEKLPPKDLYFLIRLDYHRRDIYKIHGRGSSMSNAYEKIHKMLPGKEQVDYERYGKLCYERADQLMDRMRIIKSTWKFTNWRDQEITANPGKKPYPLIQNGEHHVVCYIFNDGKSRIEIAADSWANTLTLASVWWKKWDKESYKYLASSNDWCGNAYRQLELKRQQDAEKFQKNNFKNNTNRLNQLKNSLQNLQW